MTKTELLALADALMNVAVSEGDWTAPATAAGILRKLAALEPVAWAYSEERFGRSLMRLTHDNPGEPAATLYNLIGIIDHE